MYELVLCIYSAVKYKERFNVPNSTTENKVKGINFLTKILCKTIKELPQKPNYNESQSAYT